MSMIKLNILHQHNALKKYLIYTVSVIAGCITLYSGLAYWMGIKAEQTLQEQHNMLAAMSLFKVKSHTYQRGWFSSTEKTELVFNRQLFVPYENVLPEQMRSLLDKTISYTNQIKHGPLPGLSSFNLIPGRALVKTEFAFSDETRKKLDSFFGKQAPITLTNRISFTGGGKMWISVPSFDYEEALSGVKINWKGLNLTVNYSQDFNDYQTENMLPGLTVIAGDKGQLIIDNIHYVTDSRFGKTELPIGSSDLTVNNIAFQWNEGIPYNIKLNELLYIITHIRLGEFINPSGNLELSNVQLDKLHYRIVTSEQDEFINSRGQITFDKLALNKLVYGPLSLDASVTHLHGPTLKKLFTELAKLTNEKGSPEELRQRYFNTVIDYGKPMLTKDPKFTLNEFSLKMPNGLAKADGQISLTGLSDKDFQDNLTLIKHIDANGKFSLPRKTLEELIVAQARNLFMVDVSAEDQPDVEEIDELARQLLKDQLQAWENDGYIEEKQGQISSALAMKNGEFSVNSKRVIMPWEDAYQEENSDDYLDLDEENNSANGAEASHTAAEKTR